MKVPVAVVILTYNEENNIRACLESVSDFSESIFVVDSGSTDQTLQIASEFKVTIVHNKFENYSQQRNWALSNLPIQTEWVINLDADHRLTPELKKELISMFNTGIPHDINGFLVSRRTIFMGKWIRYGGHYPTYHAVMFRKGFGKCEEKLYDQHFVVNGKSLKLKGDVIDLITESLTTFTERHNKWSTLEAIQQTSKKDLKNNDTIQGSLRGNAIQSRRYVKNIYEKFPLFFRPFLYFIIRYFFRLGFLDGTRGLIFHFLQCFWFRFLIDAKIYERKKHN
jgi:glycosyltransferase involved in cell wall biosynthesis